MASFDISTFAALAVDTGTEVAVEAYDLNDAIYPQVTEVVPIQNISHPIAGDKSTTLIDGVAAIRRGVGEQFAMQTMGQGYTPQGAVHRFGASISFDEDHLQTIAANPQAAINMVSEFAAAFTRESTRDTDRIVAKCFAQSAFTAGLTDLDGEVLDNSFVGNADPYPGLGFDGKPWASGAHVLKFSSTTPGNHTASLPLSQTNVNAAYTNGTTSMAVDESGRKIRLGWNRCMVPAALRGTAMQVFETDLVTGSGNNDKSLLTGLNITPIVNPYLDEYDADGWYLLGEGTPGVRLLHSGIPVFRSYVDEKTRALVITAQYHRGIYLRDWRKFQALNVATS